MAIEEEEDSGGGAPDWIVTFSDMVSLLVTFFILLMTFSSLEQWDVFNVFGNIEGTRGILRAGGGKSATDPPAEDLMSAMDARRGAPIPHSRPVEELAENLEEMGRKKTPEDVEIDLQDVADGLVLRFDERASFSPGSARVPPALREALVDIAGVLEHYPHMILVEGFTADDHQPTPEYPTAEDLALARASAAADVLLSASRILPTRIQVAGLGPARPIASNETAAGRARNRRVELRILSLSKARQEATQRQSR